MSHQYRAGMRLRVCVCVQQKQAAISQTHLARTLAARERLGHKKRIDITRIIKEVSEAGGRARAGGRHSQNC